MMLAEVRLPAENSEVECQVPSQGPMMEMPTVSGMCLRLELHLNQHAWTKIMLLRTC